MSKVVDLTAARFQRQLAHADRVFEYDMVAGTRLRDCAHLDRMRADPSAFPFPDPMVHHDDNEDEP